MHAFSKIIVFPTPACPETGTGVVPFPRFAMAFDAQGQASAAAMPHLVGAFGAGVPLDGPKWR